MSKFFSSVYEVESHDKSRQSDLALEKFWVMQCDCIGLCPNFAIGMTIDNCRNLFFYGIKRDHYGHVTGLRGKFCNGPGTTFLCSPYHF